MHTCVVGVGAVVTVTALEPNHAHMSTRMRPIRGPTTVGAVIGAKYGVGVAGEAGHGLAADPRFVQGTPCSYAVKRLEITSTWHLPPCTRAGTTRGRGRSSS